MKKRILILANIAIYPADVGNKARIWTLLQQLEESGHDVWFGGIGLNEKDAAIMREALGERFLWAPFRSLRNSESLPTALVKGLGIRLAGRGLIVPDIDLWYRSEWDAAIQQWHREYQFDAVFVEYVFFSRALLNFGPEVLKLIDTHDVFADRYKKLRQNGIRRFWFVTNKKQERRGLARADVVIAIQDHEAEYFRQQGCRRVITIGHSVKIEPLPMVKEPLIGYFGSGNGANIQALESFLAEVWPLVQQAAPQARLLIGGGVANFVPPRPDLELKPIVENPVEIYARAAVMVNPMRVGTGLKIKSIEALGYGRPLVSTSIGAHGLEAAVGRAFLVSDQPSVMAKMIVSLLQSPEWREHFAEAAVSFAEHRNAELRATLGALFAGHEELAAA